MLSLPIIVAAVVFKGSEAIAEGISIQLIAGVVAAAVSGWLAIAVLLKFVARNNYAIFAVYRLLFGGIILLIAYLRA
ncbi:undecaprenyl pyrophosphate phosphatase [compost metagenome]